MLPHTHQDWLPSALTELDIGKLISHFQVPFHSWGRDWKQDFCWNYQGDGAQTPPGTTILSETKATTHTTSVDLTKKEVREISLRLQQKGKVMEEILVIFWKEDTNQVQMDCD